VTVCIGDPVPIYEMPVSRPGRHNLSKNPSSWVVNAIASGGYWSLPSHSTVGKNLVKVVLSQRLWERELFVFRE
jgi:hypothetical protein